MGWASISITDLEKSARTFAAKPEKMGFNVEVDVFKCGKRGSVHYGPSYVELWVDGKDEEFSTVKFYADGYGGHEICGVFGGDKWSEMKAKALEFMKKRMRNSFTS